jgi:hypothetical protein
MPEGFRLFLDQMFNLDIARALRKEGYDVIRASETDKPEPMIKKFWEGLFLKTKFLLLSISILVTGLFSL